MKKLYFAVNGCGRECVFTTYPVRDDHFKVWKGEMSVAYHNVVCHMISEGLLTIPPLSWKDEPVAIEITISVV